MKFYLNTKSNTLVTSTEVLALCEDYKELTPNTTDAATEKHIPVVTVDGNKVSVCVGEVIHPMTEAHLITEIILETENGFEVRKLNPSVEPKAEFITNDKPVAVYEYCNLHGLWVAPVK